MEMETTKYPALGRTIGGGGGRGRTGKDANVKDVDAEADGEGITMPSSSTLYGDGVGDKYNDQDVSSRPCAST